MEREKYMPQEKKEVMIPESEFVIEFVRSSGPGGQNVNKVSSKAQLRWDVGAAAIFSEEQKELIRQNLKGRLNKRDEIVVSCDEERSQPQNKEKAIKIFNELIARALEVPEERIPTKPTRGSKEERLERKKQVSKKKEDRRKKFDY